MICEANQAFINALIMPGNIEEKQSIIGDLEVNCV
jgi:hypothetical protein